MIYNSQPQSVLTVSQFTRSIKALVEGEYRFVRISGEISNLKTPYSGHSYFSLKDENASIRAVLFKNQKRYLEHRLQDGLKVVCFGRISVYEPRGDYQIIVDTVEQYGVGNLQLEFEKLKRKLADEGLFSTEHKKKIPPFPAKIAIISSPTGAALRDFLKIAATKESHVNFQIIPVRVQGKEASFEIANAIGLANSFEDIDIIVLCRGGGSIEDLWAFNEERVARSIFTSYIPVVTGIGHEVDFTIADFCADFRYPTPTGVAAEILPDVAEVKHHLSLLRKRLFSLICQKIDYLETILQQNIRLLSDLDRMFENLDLRLNLSRTYFYQAIDSNLTDRENKHKLLLQKLESHSPMTGLSLQEHKLKLLSIQLTNRMQSLLKAKGSELANIATHLQSVSPLATLARGYSIVTGINSSSGKNEVISRYSETEVGADVEITLHQGSLKASVTEVKS